MRKFHLVSIIIVCILVLFGPSMVAGPAQQTVPVAQPTEQTAPLQVLSVERSVAHVPVNMTEKKIVPAGITVSLRAGETTYEAVVPPNASVYDAMTVLASTTSFRFGATYHSDLGYFVREIGGVENAQGTYWTLYVNGAYSMVGASQYKLVQGDRIEWKYEQK